MISTQKLIILVIGLNLICGLASIFTNETAQEYDTRLQNISDIYEEEARLGSTNDSVRGHLGGENIQETGLLSNPLVQGTTIWNILGSGINPFSINPADFNTNLEKTIAWGIGFIRTILNLILILEFYLIIRNKKNT